MARDEMDVDMHARLAGRLADVHADIVAVRRVLPRDIRLRLIQQRDNRRLLGRRHPRKNRRHAARGTISTCPLLRLLLS